MKFNMFIARIVDNIKEKPNINTIDIIISNIENINL